MPLSTYPRIVRVWTFPGGRDPFTAQLLDVHDKQVSLAAESKELTVPLAQLDADSRLIALTAEPCFEVERQLSLLLQHASRSDPFDPGADGWQQQVRDAERELSRYLVTFRYRVTGISARSEPRHTKSRIGEYRLSLRPLYSCQIEMPDIQGRKIAGRYLQQYYVPAETFTPEKALVGETILEFSGRVRIQHSTQEQSPHYQIAAAGSPAFLALTFTPNAARIFMPDDDATAVERLFVADATAIPGEADIAAVAQDTPMPKPSSTTAPRRRVTASAGEVISVAGTAKRQLIVCRNAAVTISGSRHDVRITGKCVKLTVSGTANRVRLNEVTTISVAGRDNLIEYKRGRNGKDPEISGVTRLNTIRDRP